MMIPRKSSSLQQPLQLGVVMDPIGQINFKKDTTLALLWAAQDRGWELFYMEQTGLSLIDGSPVGLGQRLCVSRDPAGWFSLQGEPMLRPLGELDVILMRKDPPFDMNYIYSTYVLEAACGQGVLVVNRPDSLRDCNEKIFATHFPQCMPPTLVTASGVSLRQFASQHKDIVLKPLDGMGGEGVFRVLQGDANLGVIIEMLSHHGKRPIMAQAFIPEISQGDKRILMLNGDPVPYCLARIPREGEARGNLAAGGRGEVRALSERDRWIAAQTGPTLREKGILFAGLDVIGDYLTEINITSPTCMREIEAAQSLGIAEQVMDVIEQKLPQISATPTVS